MCEVDLALALQQQIRKALDLAEKLREKDKLIHSIAHDLIKLSKILNSDSIFIEHDVITEMRSLANNALDSITDKGEKDD